MVVYQPYDYVMKIETQNEGFPYFDTCLFWHIYIINMKLITFHSQTHSTLPIFS